MDTIPIKRKNIIIKKIVKISKPNIDKIIVAETIIPKIVIDKKALKPKCPHAREKYDCKDCGGKGICCHNKRQRFCVDCNGSQTCKHKKIKIYCKECSNISKCPHQKTKAYCKICTPSCYCIHNKLIKNCIVCKPLNFCTHLKRKTECKLCSGSSFCIHSINKQNCKTCKGSNICKHNKTKNCCKICKASSLCKHKRFISRCKDCKGSSFCKHGKRRTCCKICGGSAFCLHGKLKQSCKNCKGGSVCVHEKLKRFCKTCHGGALCKSTWCTARSIKKYNNYCMVCCIQLCPDIKISRNYKTKENTVVTSIKEAFPNFTWVCDKKVEDGCSRRRPDLLLDMGTHIIIVEVDENKHTDYDCSCENKRLMEISKDVGHRSIVFIRFNPDGYKDKDGKSIKSCWICTKQGAMVIVKTKQAEWDERLKSLKTQIQYWIDNKTEKTVEIVELFY